MFQCSTMLRFCALLLMLATARAGTVSVDGWSNQTNPGSLTSYNSTGPTSTYLQSTGHAIYYDATRVLGSGGGWLIDAGLTAWTFYVPASTTIMYCIGFFNSSMIDYVQSGSFTFDDCEKRGLSTIDLSTGAASSKTAATLGSKANYASTPVTETRQLLTASQYAPLSTATPDGAMYMMTYILNLADSPSSGPLSITYPADFRKAAKWVAEQPSSPSPPPPSPSPAPSSPPSPPGSPSPSPPPSPFPSPPPQEGAAASCAPSMLLALLALALTALVLLS